MTEEIDVQATTGNVFDDLGLPNPEEMVFKAELARQIGEIIAKRQIRTADSH